MLRVSGLVMVGLQSLSERSKFMSHKPHHFFLGLRRPISTSRSTAGHLQDGWGQRCMLHEQYDMGMKLGKLGFRMLLDRSVLRAITIPSPIYQLIKPYTPHAAPARSVSITRPY
jgi:hypothetical protein